VSDQANIVVADTTVHPRKTLRDYVLVTPSVTVFTQYDGDTFAGELSITLDSLPRLLRVGRPSPGQMASAILGALCRGTRSVLFRDVPHANENPILVCAMQSSTVLLFSEPPANGLTLQRRDMLWNAKPSYWWSFDLFAGLHRPGVLSPEITEIVYAAPYTGVVPQALLP